MIVLHYGNFPVNMFNTAAQVFGDFNSGYDLLSGAGFPASLVIPSASPNTHAEVRLFGAFAYDAVNGSPAPVSTVNRIEIYSHDDIVSQTDPRLIVFGLPNLPVYTVIDDVLADRSIGPLYPSADAQGVEAEIRGSSFGDTLVGGVFDDDVLGAGGDDLLIGLAGSDFLDGMTGVDTLRGGAGDDFYGVDAAGDTVQENAGEGFDLVRSAVTYVLPDHVEDLALAAFGAALNGTGNGLGNVLAGNDFNNRLLGLGGNDTLVSGLGNDTLDGGVGNDSMLGGAGSDLFVWRGADLVDGGLGNDTLRFTGLALDLTRIANTSIANVERIDMTGAGSNTLTLNRGDVLSISTITDTLKILGNSGDTVDLPAVFTDEGISAGFHRYRSGAAIVLVDNDINVI